MQLITQPADREEREEAETPEIAALGTGVPHIARVYDYRLGGTNGRVDLDLMEPGVVQLHRWRPARAAPGTDLDLPSYGGVGRKP